MAHSSWLTRDAALLLASNFVRTTGYGLIGVLLVLRLAQIGLSPAQVGTVLSATLAGSALLIGFFITLADRIGRRRTLMFAALVMAASGLIFAFTSNYWVLILAALTGTISPTSSEIGPFESLEQAMTPEVISPQQRNEFFSWYSTVGAVAAALGSLLAGTIGWAQARLALDPPGVYGVYFVFFAGLGLVACVLFLAMSPRVEIKRGTQQRAGLAALGKSRGTVLRLAGLFGLDSFGGGFVVQSLIVLWFHQHFGVGAETLGPVFSAVQIIKAGSYLVAGRVANRIGLVNTMVFTHLPSNILLMLVPLAPTLPLAITFLLLRHTFSQMDVPTRQSYVVAVVSPEERTAAAGVTNAVRPIAQAISPTFAGLLLQVASGGLPFFIGGTLKIVYDLSLFFSFRAVKPPEETKSI